MNYPYSPRPWARRKVFKLHTVIARVQQARTAKIRCGKCGLTPAQGASLRKIGHKLFICNGGHIET